MALIGLTSLSGSPGVTTAAVAWATCSQTPTLLIEADLTGGSPILAGRFRSTVPHERSLLALATYDVESSTSDVLREQALDLPGAVADSKVVPGLAEHSQATALTGLWADLGLALQDLSSHQGIDILVDLGRLSTGAPWTLIAHLDQLLVMAPATLPGLITLHNNLPGLAGRLTQTALGVVLVAPAREGFGVKEAGQVLAPVPVLTALPHLPKPAAAYSLGWPQASKGSLRTLHKEIYQLQDAAAQHRADHTHMLKGQSA